MGNRKSRLVTALIALCWLSSLCLANREAGPWRNSLEEALREAAGSHRLVLVHFWSEHCGPCMRLEGRVLSQRACIQALQANYVAVKVNVEQHPELARQFRVDRIPTDIILLPSGEELHRSISPSDLDRYVALLDQVAAHYRVGQQPPTAVALAPSASSSQPVLAATTGATPPTPQTLPTAQPVVSAERVPSNDPRTTSETPPTWLPATRPDIAAARQGQPVGQSGQWIENPYWAARTSSPGAAEPTNNRDVPRRPATAPAAADVARTDRPSDHPTHPVSASQQPQHIATPSTPSGTAVSPATNRPLSRYSEMALRSESPTTVPQRPTNMSAVVDTRAGAGPGYSLGGYPSPPAAGAGPANDTTTGTQRPPFGQSASEVTAASMTAAANGLADAYQGLNVPEGSTRSETVRAESARWAAVPPSSPPASATRYTLSAPYRFERTPTPDATAARLAVPVAHSSTASQTVVPAPLGSPAAHTAPLGLDGFCPVSLVDENVWRSGSPNWMASYEGRIYFFSSPDKLRAFQQNPRRYAPALGGFDVVQYYERGVLIPGKRQHGVAYGGRYYLFSDESSLNRFWQNPQAYSTPPAQKPADVRG